MIFKSFIDPDISVETTIVGLGIYSDQAFYLIQAYVSALKHAFKCSYDPKTDGYIWKVSQYVNDELNSLSDKLPKKEFENIAILLRNTIVLKQFNGEVCLTCHSYGIRLVADKLRKYFKKIVVGTICRQISGHILSGMLDPKKIVGDYIPKVKGKPLPKTIEFNSCDGNRYKVVCNDENRFLTYKQTKPGEFKQIKFYELGPYLPKNELKEIENADGNRVFEFNCLDECDKALVASDRVMLMFLDFLTKGQDKFLRLWKSAGEKFLGTKADPITEEINKTKYYSWQSENMRITEEYQQKQESETKRIRTEAKKKIDEANAWCSQMLRQTDSRLKAEFANKINQLEEMLRKDND